MTGRQVQSQVEVAGSLTGWGGEQITLVELFAGIGGFSAAFENFGVKTTGMVEIDPKCRSVLRKNFPEAALFDDVTKVSGNDLRATGFVPERGVLTGGWPCQDISIAGKQKGLAGSRSGLFWEVVRLLSELHPKWFILENVPRLLSINNGRDMGAVVAALGECGYGVAWRVLDAQYFGIPQRRRRIFFVGCFGDTGESAAEILFERESLRWNPQACEEQGKKNSTQTLQGFESCCGSCGGGLDIVGTLQTNQRGCPDTDSVAGGQLVVEHVRLPNNSKC